MADVLYSILMLISADTDTMLIMSCIPKNIYIARTRSISRYVIQMGGVAAIGFLKNKKVIIIKMSAVLIVAFLLINKIRLYDIF